MLDKQKDTPYLIATSENRVTTLTTMRRIMTGKNGTNELLTLLGLALLGLSSHNRRPSVSGSP